MVSRVLEKTGATKRDRGILYKAVVRMVLLHRNESLVITEEMMKALEAF